MAHLHPVDEAILQVLAKHAEGVRGGSEGRARRCAGSSVEPLQSRGAPHWIEPPHLPYPAAPCVCAQAPDSVLAAELPAIQLEDRAHALNRLSTVRPRFMPEALWGPEGWMSLPVLSPPAGTRPAAAPGGRP